MRTRPLLTLLPMALPALTHASPQPALVAEEYMHLMPRNTLFFRQTTDLQSFTSALGGAAADSITNSGDSERPFQVDGDTFTDFESAAQRSCDNQFNECSQRANEQGNKGDFKVEDCDDQKGRLDLSSFLLCLDWADCGNGKWQMGNPSSLLSPFPS